MSKSNSKYPSLFVAAGAAVLAIYSPGARSEDFTARTLMQRMQGAERFAYVAGVVEGLSVARFMRDGQQPQGRRCINDWFYQGQDAINAIYAAFERYPTYPPGAVIDVLAKQRCGA